MHEKGSPRGPGRSASEEREFREAYRLLVAFGVSAIPATLLLGVMGIDFLEGDFGAVGTLAMTLAGGMSLVAAGVGVVARRRWDAGRPLGQVLALMSWPPVLALMALWVSLLAFAAEFSFLLGEP